MAQETTANRPLLSLPADVSPPQMMPPLDDDGPIMSRNVHVQLHYLKADATYYPKPIQITPSFLDIERRTNVLLEQGPFERIRDVRGRERDFSLDTHGFQFVHAPTEFREWSSHAGISCEYLPELECLLKRELHGCDEIMFYDARIRHADDAGRRVQGPSFSPFAQQVHCDTTEKSVLTKIKNLTELKSEYLLSGRVRIVNVWRPIRHPVFDCGLAVADGGKLLAGDVIECDRHRQDTGEYWDTMGVVKFRDGFEWWYKYQQDESDVLLFKNYDSSNDTDIKARTCLHTAFEMPHRDIPANAPTRESIEVRALIFTYPQTGTKSPKPRSIRLSQAESSLNGSLEHIRMDNITHRLRTDIDEANEIKDAVLILRRQEIQRLIRQKNAGDVEREALLRELELANRQIDLQAKYIKELLRKMKDSAGTGQSIVVSEPQM